MLTYDNLLGEIRHLMSEKGILDLQEKKSPTSDGSSKQAASAIKSLEEMLGAMTIDIKKWGTRPEGDEEADQERQIIQNYVQSIGGNDPDSILQNLAASFGSLEEGKCEPQKAGNCNLGRLVSQIQLLNTMSRVLTNFGASEAGFIMEAFLSAMFPGGQVVPVGSDTIADFKVKSGSSEANYSLKTIDNATGVTGSVTELVKSITPESPMVYYIFAKAKGSAKGVTDRIDVWKFEINYDNIAQVIAKNNKSAQKRVQKAIDQIRATEDQDTQAIGALKSALKGFNIGVKKYQKLAGGSPVATLVLDPTKLYSMAECELASVKEQLIDIQKSYASLVFQMNKYFATMSVIAADDARTASSTFNDVVERNVQGDKTCDT